VLYPLSYGGRAISVPQPDETERQSTSAAAWHRPLVLSGVTYHVRELISQRSYGLVWHSFAM
jgi:hypothetical protein